METDDGGCTRGAELIAPPEFDDLYREYKPAVFGFAYYLTQNRGEAEDLFQEAWLRIVRKMPEKVNMKSIKAWIFTIVINLYRDLLRKKRIRRLFFLRRSLDPGKVDVLFPDVPGRFPSDQTKETDHTDMRRDIARAIAVLPDRQRRVFVLKEIAGFQQAEIGEILNLPVGTVKSLMYRAVKRLQRELSAYNPKFINEGAKNEV